MPEVQLDQQRCTGCGMCVNFCPVEVFDLVPGNGGNGKISQATREEACWACDTCVGQCPTGAIRIIELEGETALKECDCAKAEPIDNEERSRYEEWHRILYDTLRLRWYPVAISLIAAHEPLPNVPMPRVKLRFCQSLMMARRGKSLLMPPQCHACPDGTHIMGLTEIPPKLATGEMYIHFKKLDSMEAARQMIKERPRLVERSMRATLVTPLKDAVATPDVIAIVANPEQIMWLCMGAAYFTGRRFEFNANGYNAQCVETTLIPYLEQKFNISFGCYGCRASSDVSDDLMFMGIPIKEMPVLLKGLQQLGRKAITDSRNKIYLPPNI